LEVKVNEIEKSYAAKLIEKEQEKEETFAKRKSEKS